jgi:pyruvate/2-oxoglutarate dehydrogenase complex dihydrolipoamide acyltransferase (E2) component
MSQETEEKKKADYHGIAIAQVIPLKAVRKKIAEHMLQSHLTAARVTSLHEIDVTELVAKRNELLQHPESLEGVRISYTHLLLKAISQALRKHLIFNATLVENEILIFEDINIGMALTMPDGNLIVPVIHQVDRKNILEIARRAIDLEDRAKTGKLTVADMQKGTFTLSNVGMLPEARWFTPIINQGQSALLGTGAIRQAPVVRNGQIVIRWVITTSLTYDHRIVNNGIFVEYFIQTLVQLLEDPSKIELWI